VALYMERGVSRSVCGMWGSLGRIWLGERDGGECERGPGGVLLDQKLGCEAAALYLIDMHLGDIDPMSPSKHYRTKDRGGCYSIGRPEGEGSAGLVNGRLWWSFK
jgi:hypothetical protein